VDSKFRSFNFVFFIIIRIIIIIELVDVEEDVV